jgi:hypothetical protein
MMRTEEANCTNADAMNLSGKRTEFGQHSEKLEAAPTGQRFFIGISQVNKQG